MTPEQADAYILRMYPGRSDWIMQLYKEFLIHGREHFFYCRTRTNKIDIRHCSDYARPLVRPLIAKLRLMGITITGWD